MNGLGLSAEAIAARRKYVQAGDADRIMRGEWRAVWREKAGLDEGPDLSGVLPVQLGSMTEPLNLAWCEKVTGRTIYYYSDNKLMRRIWEKLTGRYAAAATELQVSEAYPWMAANLDGMTTTPQGHRCVVDAKHLGQAYEQEILRYTAAMTHQATVMGCDWWALSCLIGNRKHEIIYQEVDPLYQARLIATTREFWTFVESGIEPEDRTEPKPPPKPQPKRREIVLPAQQADANWSGDFMRLARDFAGTHDAAVRHAITREEIKALVPDDVGKVTFGLVRYGRDGRGQTIALDKPEETGQ
jgi:hypothetical protein